MPIANGLHFFLHEGGKPTSPPMVLIHGAGGDHLSWPPEIRRLPGAHVFAVDLPGHGKSVGLGCQTVEDYAQRLIDFVDEIRLSRAVFVGHGMGGAIALSLALDHPERVAGLVLISCGPRLPVPSSILENAASPATFRLAIQALLELMKVSLTAANIKDRMFSHLSSIRQTLLLGDLRACDRFDVYTRLKTIQTAVLAVCGIEDELTPRQFSEQLAGIIADAALQTVDGTGHLVMLEQPHRVAGLLRVFLNLSL